MGELGFLGAPIPEQYGGLGMDYISFALLCEELERADTAFRVVQSVHVGLNSLTLLQWGTEDQRQRFLVPQAKGEKLATFGADRARRGHRRRATSRRPPGATATTTSSTATRSGSASPTSRTTSSCSRRSTGRSGTRASPRSWSSGACPGLSTGTLHGKLGIRAGNTGLIDLEDVRVPAANRIGEEGEGFLIAMSAIDQGRYTVAAGAVGLAQACLDASRPVRPRAADVRRGDRPPPARQADDRDHGQGDRDRAAARVPGGLAQEPGPAQHPRDVASPSGTRPTTRSRPRSTRSRSTARTATPTSSRSSATCATRRPP